MFAKWIQISLSLCMVLRMSKFLSLTSVSVLLLVMHVFQWIALRQWNMWFLHFYSFTVYIQYFCYMLCVLQLIVLHKKNTWFLHFYSFAVFIQYFAFSKYRSEVQHKGKVIIVFLLMYFFFYNILYFYSYVKIFGLLHFYCLVAFLHFFFYI